MVGEGDAVVSLTSYGRRIKRVHYTIERIAGGRVRPRRLILWLDDVSIVDNPPAPLRRLQKRGLEILPCRDYRPHKKYYPYVTSQAEHKFPLVTADDDVAYPKYWLLHLLENYRPGRREILCFRAHRMSFTQGRINKYANWTACATREPSILNVPTGVSGVLYPPEFLEVVRAEGGKFSELAPVADDLWLHYIAATNGYPIKQITAVPTLFRVFPYDQDISLARVNQIGGGNDEVISRLYGGEMLQRLFAGE